MDRAEDGVLIVAVDIFLVVVLGRDVKRAHAAVQSLQHRIIDRRGAIGPAEVAAIQAV